MGWSFASEFFWKSLRDFRAWICVVGLVLAGISGTTGATIIVPAWGWLLVALACAISMAIRSEWNTYRHRMADRPFVWSGAIAALLLPALSFVQSSLAQETTKMDIVGVPEDPKLQPFMGNAWALYLDGRIDSDAGKRLEDYILQHKVPAESWAVLNSPGGSLFGGMELGTVIRKYNLRTDVGVRTKQSSRTYDYEAGGCYSSCTLAYIGGSFRFLHDGSHFGIHRFAFSSPQENGIDLAQVASASIVAYLRSMDIDTDFYTLSTTAGPAEIYEPSLQELQKLNVVTNGFNKPKWTIESNNGLLYLKGERNTVYGINKLIMFCPPKSRMILHVIFDAQRHDKELLSFPAHSLVIDDQEYPITSEWKEMANGWFNSEYILTTQQLLAIGRAKSVGVIVQGGYGAPVFLGFNNMPFEDGAAKLVGLLRSCSFGQ